MGQKQTTEKSENNDCDYEENENSEQEANMYIDRDLPKNFIHCGKCLQTFIFKINIPDKTKLEYYVTFKCSCFKKFQKTSILNFMKMLKFNSPSENIDKKQLIEADIKCKIHSQLYNSFCSKCFQVCCKKCEKNHTLHHLITLETLYIFYETNNNEEKHGDALKIFTRAEKNFDSSTEFLYMNKNNELSDFTNSYDKWKDNNGPIMDLYIGLYNSYHNKNIIKYNFYFLYDFIVNFKFIQKSDHYGFTGKNDFIEIMKSCIISEEIPYLVDIIDIKSYLKNKKFKKQKNQECTETSVKNEKIYIKTMTKLNDSTFVILTNEDIALIFSFKNGNIIFHKEFSLSSDYILPLKNCNDLISCSKINTILLKYKKFATYDISLKFDFPSDYATEYEDGRIFIVSKNIIYVLQKNSNKKYEVIKTLNFSENINSKVYFYKNDFYIYVINNKLSLNSLNNYKQLKTVNLISSGENSQMIIVNKVLLIIAYGSDISIYNMYQMEYIKSIFMGEENKSNSLCDLENGILLVGFSGQLIKAYNYNNHFQEVEVWKYLGCMNICNLLYFKEEAYILFGEKGSSNESQYVFIHNVNRFLNKNKTNFWELPLEIEEYAT